MTSTTTDVPNITVTKLAALEVGIQGAEDLSFNDADLDPVSTQSVTNPAQLEHLKDFCKTRSWWECTDTQGVCQFDNGSGTCVPAPRTKDMDSYYKQWLRIYGPVYANMKMIPTSSKPCVKTGMPIEVVVVTDRRGPVIPPKRRSIRRNVRRPRLIDYSSSESEADF